MSHNRLLEILLDLENGKLAISPSNDFLLISNRATEILNKDKSSLSENDLIDMENIILISNILYNNTDLDILPIEDGVYDLLLELYKNFNPNFQVGAKPIHFDPVNEQLAENQVEMVDAIKHIDLHHINEEMMFGKDLFTFPKVTRKDFMESPIIKSEQYISKRIVSSDNKHKYPKLVGTLDKCKFVLNSQAIEKGVFNDSNVKVLERDFFGKHIEMGILDTNRKFSVVAMLKYDGISVEGEIAGNYIDTARTRGDANESLAADLTPILHGYHFPYAPLFDVGEKIGIKFEAIITYPNLEKYNMMKGKQYKNCRTAISGIFASSDAYKYRDLITLVPLETSIEEFNILDDIYFMNKYYQSGELMRYAVISGTYTEVLFQIKKFVEEAEYLRDYIPFMYDGVVITYVDEDIVMKLGRKNAINKYSMAVKFNPLKKLTPFLGYTYTVGQDGVITPMIHYSPVEFYGTIHDKSSGHSYERFKTLGLKPGDLIEVEYVNDVMPYVSKPNNSHNDNNTNIPVQFITHCPSCGNELKISKSGKSVICDNMQCPERNLQRVVSMMDKLNLKDFSEAYLSQIARYTLTDMLNVKKDDIDFLGDITAQKFIDRMNEIKTVSMYDYKLVGALGFTGIAEEKWKLILNHYSINDILSMDSETLKNSLVQIKGIGPTTADIISTEMEFFKKDLMTISMLPNIITSKGIKNTGKIIRFTGFRDKDLVDLLVSIGHDASSTGGVTKKTDILLVPVEGHTSSKTKQAGENTQIISVQEFKNNMDKYLS